MKKYSEISLLTLISWIVVYAALGYFVLSASALVSKDLTSGAWDSILALAVLLGGVVLSLLENRSTKKIRPTPNQWRLLETLFIVLNIAGAEFAGTLHQIPPPVQFIYDITFAFVVIVTFEMRIRKIRAEQVYGKLAAGSAPVGQSKIGPPD